MTWTAQSRRVFAINSTAHATHDGLSSAFFILLPILAQAFGLSYAQVGLFKGLKSLSQALLEMVSGIFCERLGERRVLLTGLLLSGAGYIGFSAATGPLGVLACFLVVGAGGGLHHAPSSGLVSAAFSADRRRGTLGLYNAAGDAGKLAFTGVFALAAGAGLAWQGVTLVYGLITIAVAGFVFVSLGRLGIGERPSLHTGEDRPATSSTGWGIANRSAFTALLAAVSLDSMVQAGALTFITFLFVAKNFALSLASASVVLLLVGGMFGKAGCGFLAARLGVRRAFALVQALTALGLVAVVAAPGLWAFALLPLLGAVLQGSTSITYGMVGDFVSTDRTARGFALVYASSGFASVAGPVGFGLVADAYGIGQALVVMAGASLLAVLPVLVLRDEPAGHRAAHQQRDL